MDTNIKSAEDLIKKYPDVLKKIPVDLEKILKKENIEYMYSTELKIDNVEILGAIRKEQDNIKLLVNKFAPKEKQRYTIAHELGVLFLEMISKEKDIHIEYKNSYKKKTMRELTIKKFAEQLLIPDELLKEVYSNESMPTAKNLSKKFQVSLATLKNRLRELNLNTVD